MKKTMAFGVLTALALLNFAPAMAQDSGISVRGGLSFYKSSFEFMGFEDTSDSRMGFTAGISLIRPISSLITVQPELLFVQKGGSDSDADFDDSEFTLNYLDVPVHFKVNIPMGDLRPFAAVSPYAGYLVSATEDEDGEDPKEFLKDFNYGIILGGGVNFGRLSIQAGYDLGLANIWDDADLFGDEDFGDEDFGDFFGDMSGVSFKSSGFTLTLGINF